MSFFNASFILNILFFWIGDLGIPIRPSSIKRQTHNSSSNNNNSPRIKRNHQRVQRSPLPPRTKRMGDIGHSTASLNSVNSIEV